MSLPTDLARAVAFLSRLPVPSRFFDGDDGRLSRTVRAFPLAGIVLSLPAALLLSLLAWIEAPPLLAAGLAVALQAGVTGALHEDGLADTADGLGAGADRQRALDIMKDSRIGVFGVVALLMALLLRVAALAALIPVLSPAGLFLVVLAAAAASRAAMVWHWKSLPPARPDGVAASDDRKPTRPGRRSPPASALRWLRSGWRPGSARPSPRSSPSLPPTGFSACGPATASVARPATRSAPRSKLWNWPSWSRSPHCSDPCCPQ
jgi:cobalamin 5'-phosphate synthase/cobalamin synthase